MRLEDTMAGYYQLIEDAAGRAMFVLRAGNHETVLTSSVFQSRRDALNAADWLRHNGQDRSRFLRRETDHGRPFFLILGPDGCELARSSPYAGRSGYENGIASAQRNCAAREFRGLVRTASLSV